MKYTILILASLLLPGISIHAQDAELDVLSREAAESLSSLLRGMETLTAEVNVLTLEQDGREIQETTSGLIMQKPDHFSLGNPVAVSGIISDQWQPHLAL